MILLVRIYQINIEPVHRPAVSLSPDLQQLFHRSGAEVRRDSGSAQRHLAHLAALQPILPRRLRSPVTNISRSSSLAVERAGLRELSRTGSPRE